MLAVDLADVAELLAELAVQLTSVGMVLVDGPDGVRLAHAARPDDDHLEKLLRAQHASHGLTAVDATLLAKALRGTLDTRTLSNSERVALARLQNAGIFDDTSITEAAGLGLLRESR